MFGNMHLQKLFAFSGAYRFGGFFIKRCFNRLFLRQSRDIIRKIALELMQGEKDI